MSKCSPSPEDLGERIRQARGTDKPSERERRIRAAMGTPAPPAVPAASLRTGQAPPPHDLASLARKKQKDNALTAALNAIVSRPPFIDADRDWLKDLDEDVLARLAGLKVAQPPPKSPPPPSPPSSYGDFAGLGGRR